MPELIDSLKTQPFNFALFFLVIFLGMWIANLLSQAKMRPGFIQGFTELMAGIVLGLLIGLALTFHQFTGILSVGSFTLGIFLIINAPAEKKIQRLLGVGAAWISAIWLYWYTWEDLGYLFQIIIQDFQ
jgi:hypothetical protein